MIGDMKIEDGSLTQYLVANLEPLTETDPLILAKYVEALLKKDKPAKELEKLCAANLHEFLGHETNSFVAKLFQDLESGSILSSIDSRELAKQIKASPATVAANTSEIEGFSPKEERFPSTSQCSDSEKNDITDDEDDDRNHKHRRRETQSQSLDRDDQDLIMHIPSRKRSKGQTFLDTEPQSSVRKQFDLANRDRDTAFKFEKRQPGLSQLSRPPFDGAPRTRFNSYLRNNSSSHFDASISFGRSSIGRGRGRGTGIWNMHDSRFSSVETLDFPSSLAPCGPAATNLFPGRGLANAATTPSTVWNAFGMIHGMPNGGLDPLHPLHSGLQGPLPRPLNPSINIGLPRARCRDFEERGFCLRGDMCPMEHGVNRIVVEDVQSLSQFNLPVSIPSAPILGVPSGSGLVTSASLPKTTLLSGNKASDVKAGKYGPQDEDFGTNGAVSSSAAENEADLYDPDKPLWNNERLETSGGLVALSPPKADDADPVWGADSSGSRSFRFSDNSDNNKMGRNVGISSLAQPASSVWGRIGGSSSKLDVDAKLDNDVDATSYSAMRKKELEVEKLSNAQGTSHQGKQARGELQTKSGNILATHRAHLNTAPGNAKGSEKAYSTLFVNCIPQKNNKRELLLSHFQKFGDVIDIYIPPNSEKAFLQFSRREDAEAALRAPDAVMGNRFIKLWWANRDNIPHEGEGYANYPSTTFLRGVTVMSQSSIDRGRENLQSSSRACSYHASEMPTADTATPKQAATESATDASLQKKLELELLKEELRKKQELLDQKRNDFKRQLDKLEKQGVTVKGENAEKIVQQPRAAAVPLITDAIAPEKVSTPSSSGHLQVKMLEKGRSGENVVSANLKTHPDMQQQSPKGLKQMSHLPAAIGAASVVNRFKLDNRPTGFRVLSPIPTNLANVSLLKEHFAAFGDLSAVEMEVMDGHNDSVDEHLVKDCSARIIFSTRRSAERAFFHGKCLQGHTFQFAWLPNSSTARQSTPGELSGSSSKKEPDLDHIAPERSESCSPSPSTQKLSQGSAVSIPAAESVQIVEESKTCEHQSTTKQETESSVGRPPDDETTTGQVEQMDVDSKNHDPAAEI